MLKRTILAVLLFCILLESTSCTAKESQNLGTVSDEKTPASVMEEPLESLWYSDLDYNNEDTVILSRAGDSITKREFYVEEQTGEQVNDAVYMRNIHVEEALHVKLQQIAVDVTRDGPNEKIKTMVQAGESVDIASNHMFHNAGYIADGLYQDLHHISTIDMNRPYWNQSFNYNSAINGKNYQLLGDASLTQVAGVYVTFFNWKLWQDHFKDEIDPYQLAESKQWTLDKMFSLSKNIYQDANGNGEADGDDIYGFARYASGLVNDAILGGSEIRFGSLDENNLYHQTAHTDERIVTFIEKVNQLFYSENCTYCMQKNYMLAQPSQQLYMLNDDKALFMMWRLGDGVEWLSDMESDYGVLPIPKLDETQEHYAAWTHDGASVVCIPKTCQNSEKAGAVISLICEKTRENILPIYYDSILKNRYTRDENTAKMIDLIMENINMSFDYIYQGIMTESSYVWLFRNKIFNRTLPADNALSILASCENMQTEAFNVFVQAVISDNDTENG